MVFTIEQVSKHKSKATLDDALDTAGFGRYNYGMLVACCLMILAMYLDIFGFSVMMPATACDMDLSTSQQGLLSAVPLIGVMCSSYIWGLSADTLGRRYTLLRAMPVGAILNILASFAPTYSTLAIFKFLSAAFTSSANAAAFVLMGESAPPRHRSRVMFVMASATFLVQFLICLFALPIFQLSFRVSIPWLALEYRPWRLLMLVISFPGIFGVIILLFLQESPKYLLSKSLDDQAINVLRRIYSCNSVSKNFYIESISHEEAIEVQKETSFLRRMWDQTAPLFKPPLLKNSLMLYYILLCAYMTSTGYTMWIPTVTNAYFTGDDKTGKTSCDVASSAASASSNTTSTDCDTVIKRLTLYAVMCQSGVAGIINILISFIVGYTGKKRMTLAVFTMSISCGVILLLVKIPMLSIIMFYVFLYICFVLGNVNTYLVELNPTHLRGMATCLSVVVARGFGFFSVQLIAEMLEDNCVPMVSGYVALVISGMIVAVFLPGEKPQGKFGLEDINTNENQKSNINNKI